MFVTKPRGCLPVSNCFTAAYTLGVHVRNCQWKGQGERRGKHLFNILQLGKQRFNTNVGVNQSSVIHLSDFVGFDTGHTTVTPRAHSRQCQLENLLRNAEYLWH
jgi:hypothetical protein